MAQYAVYHGSKGKGSGGGLGNHIDRVEGMEHTYPHADPSRKKHNVHFDIGKYSKMPLPKAINARIKEGYRLQRKPRRDSVKYMAHVLTGSPGRMGEIFNDRELANGWIKANYDFLAKEFGKENIVRFVLHMDEKTPHLHAVTVPLTDDGRLSARERMGNKKALQERQDRYAEAMKGFGLQRGIKATGIKHEDAKDYYKRIAKAQKEAESAILEPSKNIWGNYTTLSIENMQNALKSANMALREATEKLSRERMKARAKEKEALRENSKYLQVLKNAKEEREKNIKIYEDFVDVFRDEKKIRSMVKQVADHDFEKLAREQAEKAEEKEREKGRGFRR